MTDAPSALVVEDDAATAEVCLRMLRQLGFTVETAGSRKQAWTRLSRRRFDLVLTDVQMDDESAGVLLTEEIKSRSPDTEVILMTGNPSLETAVPALKHGAFDYLSKPFDLAGLGSVVRHCLERRRLAAELDREKSLREELASAYAELQKVERLKDAFLSRVNHELRTPVTVAVMAVDILEDRLADAPGRELWSRLDDAIRRLSATVEQLVLYSRLTQAGFAPERKELDLWTLLTGLIERRRACAQERAVTLEASRKGEAFFVSADRQLLEVAFDHLLANAVRFNKRGGRVVVRLEYREDGVEVSVADTGIGIPEDKLGSLFDRFYQVAEHLTREAGGLGLGLATVRRIVESHGGTVAVESELERGTTFSVRLPRAR